MIHYLLYFSWLVQCQEPPTSSESCHTLVEWNDFDSQEKRQILMVMNICFATDGTNATCITDGPCYWDEVANSCFIEEVVLEILGISICDFYTGLVPQMTPMNTQPQCFDLENSPNYDDLPMPYRSLANCPNLVNRGTCDGNFHPQNGPPQVRQELLNIMVLCCESCGRVLDNRNFTAVPSVCPEDYDPFCFDLIDGCSHISSAGLCLKVTGCDKTCDTCGACSDSSGVLTCGALRAQYEPDCTDGQTTTCRESCRLCPTGGLCDVMNAQLFIADINTGEEFALPSLGATFGPLRYSLASSILVFEENLCEAATRNVSSLNPVVFTKRQSGSDGCTFQTIVQNGEAMGANMVVVMNTFAGEDLVFMQADEEFPNVTIPSRFAAHNDTVAAWFGDAPANSLALLRCSDNAYYPPFLCLRNSDLAMMDGEYALTGSYAGMPYWTTSRFDRDIFIYWSSPGRFCVGTELQYNQQGSGFPKMCCLTQDDNGMYVNGIMDCTDWGYKASSTEQGVSLSITITSKRCGDQCGSSFLPLVADSGAASCESFASFGAVQALYSCDCLAQLIGHLNDENAFTTGNYSCTFGTVNLGEAWISCLDAQDTAHSSAGAELEVAMHSQGGACIAEVVSEVRTVGECQLTGDVDTANAIVYSWSQKYFCDVSRSQVGVIIYPYSVNCGDDGNQDSFWQYLDDGGVCNQISVTGRSDLTFLNTYILKEYLISAQTCATNQTINNAQATSSGISRLSLMVLLFMCWLIL